MVGGEKKILFLPKTIWGVFQKPSFLFFGGGGKKTQNLPFFLFEGGKFSQIFFFGAPPKRGQGFKPSLRPIKTARVLKAAFRAAGLVFS